MGEQRVGKMGQEGVGREGVSQEGVGQEGMEKMSERMDRWKK